MNAEKWQKINELFHESLDVEKEKRLQFIKENSNGDAEIFAEVQKLVSAHEQANNFIQNPIANDVFKIIDNQNSSQKVSKNLAQQTIGPYFLLEKLGRGAFGEVWLAEKQSSLVTAKFALKFPNNDDDIELESIRKEAELWQKASGHPNILPLIEANIYDGKAIIVSEYVKDGSLEIWLKNNGGKSPSQEKAVEIMTGILDGLEHLHNRRIIHRDLKPANILLQEGKPRLTDFGVSKILKDEGNTTKNISGTVAYMSPEALEGKRTLQSDLWSAAVVFYQMLTGQMPFQTPDQVSLMLAIVTKEPNPLPNDFNNKWEGYFKIALNKNSNLRFQSASQMKQAIIQIQNNLSLETITTLHQTFENKTDESNSIKINNQETNDFKQPLTLSELESKTNSQPQKTFRIAKFFALVGAGLLSLTLLIGGYLLFKQFQSANENKVLTNNQPNSQKSPNQNKPNQIEVKKKYFDMSERDKNLFVSEAAKNILIQINQGESSEMDIDSFSFVKGYVDSYADFATNKNNDRDDSQCGHLNSLKEILSRGSKVSSDISNEFAKNEISPLIGIYLVYIESSFCSCLQAPTGTLGLFQFNSAQANEYGLKTEKGASPSNPDGRCDPKLSAKAASIRIKKLIAEDFGEGIDKVPFAITAFNINNISLKESIEIEKKTNNSNQVKIWDLTKSKRVFEDKTQSYYVTKYFARFLAAAIVGENPKVFEIDISPLSQNTNQNFKKDIIGDGRESKVIFKVNAGETVLKIKVKATADIAGANIYFKDQTGAEVVPVVLAQGNALENENFETVKINAVSPMSVIMEIKEIQYGSRSNYFGTLEIDSSGAFAGWEK